MADTVRFEQFKILMRKIGYSVGLESTLDRLRDLAGLYRRQHQVSLGDWQDLVSLRWELRSFHIADFFKALGILQVGKGKIDVLAGLDALAVSSAGLSDTDARAAEAAIFLGLLIEHDGEIFLNCLAAGFEAEDVERKLTDLISYKRNVLFGLFKTPDVQLELARIVGIERQLTNTGSSSPAKSLSGQRRREPLERRTGDLSNPGIPPVSISADYLRKVPSRRREWAISVGLWDQERGLTVSGQRLLEHLDALGLRLETGAVVLWPFEHEILRLRLSPTTFEGRVIGYWDFVSLAIIGAGGMLKAEVSDGDAEEVAAILTRQIVMYRDLNRPKAMLRREYPLTVAFPAVSSSLLARGLAVPPLSDLIGPGKPLDVKFQYRTSRNSVGALSVR